MKRAIPLITNNTLMCQKGTNNKFLKREAGYLVKKKHEVLNGRTAKPIPPLGVIGKKGKIPWQYNHPARNQAIYFSALEWTHLITNNIRNPWCPISICNSPSAATSLNLQSSSICTCICVTFKTSKNPSTQQDWNMHCLHTITIYTSTLAILTALVRYLQVSHLIDKKCFFFLFQSPPWMQRSMMRQRRIIYNRALCSLAAATQRLLKPACRPTSFDEQAGE